MRFERHYQRFSVIWYIQSFLLTSNYIIIACLFKKKYKDLIVNADYWFNWLYMVVHTAVTKRGWIFLNLQSYHTNETDKHTLHLSNAFYIFVYLLLSIYAISVENCRVDVCSYDFILMFKTFYQTVPTCTNVTCT